MTGPISEAATGPREPAAAVPAKEGLPPGPGNPGPSSSSTRGPRAGTPVPDPRAALLALIAETGGEVTRDRRI